MDSERPEIQTERMAEGHWSMGRRVIVEDVRRDDTYMRVTWHEESGVFVVSHWRGDVCEAATRISAAAAPDLINLLVLGLAESTRPPDGSYAASAASRRIVS
jgi:hypothetical protein